MYFLDRDEAGALEKTLRRQIAEAAAPKFVLYYDSGRGRDYAAAARAVVQSAGNFSEATVLFLFAVAGDGWSEPSTSHDGWARYRGWRAAHQEMRRLYDAPGHRFAPDETAAFVDVIAFALELGWDALVTAKGGRQLLFLSHDDRLDIHRGFAGGAMIRQLLQLGYWHRAGA